MTMKLSTIVDYDPFLSIKSHRKIIIYVKDMANLNKINK